MPAMPLVGRLDELTALDRALGLGGHGPYVVQAAIASLNADEQRDLPQIAALYGELARLTGSPVVVSTAPDPPAKRTFGSSASGPAFVTVTV